MIFIVSEQRAVINVALGSSAQQVREDTMKTERKCIRINNLLPQVRVFPLNGFDELLYCQKFKADKEVKAIILIVVIL